MNRNRSLTALLLVALALGCAGKESHPGRAVVERACQRCHSLAHIEDKRQSRPEWEHTVDAMIDRGARLTAEEREEVVEYLSTSYGK